METENILQSEALLYLDSNNEPCVNTCERNADFLTIAQEHDLNWSTKWEQYPDIYENYLHKFIGKAPNYLEIGVLNGGSLQIASKYFQNANIYGVDINPKVCQMALGFNISTFCFDAKNKDDFLGNFNSTQFDIILDDGSHMSSDVIQTFKSLFARIKPGGVYMVEDLHTSYWSEYQGGHLKKSSSMEYFKSLTDILNSYYITKSYSAFSRNDLSFVNKLSEEDLYLLKWLETIHFYDAVVVLKKFNEPREKAFAIKNFGKKRPVL